MLALVFARLRAIWNHPGRPDGAHGAPGRRCPASTDRAAVVWNLSALFALDSFGGGFVVQSFAAYWFHLRFGLDPGTLGTMFFWRQHSGRRLRAVAARLAARIGLINTMVATHLPSNVLLILVPLMPTLPLAVAVLLLRFSISQMDVPAQAVVHRWRWWLPRSARLRPASRAWHERSAPP